MCHPYGKCKLYDCRWCAELDGHIDVDDGNDDDGLMFHAAGVLCRDASAQGKSWGDKGQCMPSQDCWVVERQQRQ